MNFKELMQQLPMCPGSDVLPLNKKEGGFVLANQGLPEFIGPDVSPSRAVEQPVAPQVMIISAAGAVGKSTLAKEIAYYKKAPIWDLAQAAAVGGNSLTGQIASSFGFSLAGEVNTMLVSGQLFLIIDALDEARVKANEAGYEAFINNIAEIAKEAAAISFVLLGRTQTAETSWLLLEEAGVLASLVSIQPFTRDQAEQYIKASIQHSDPIAFNRIGEHQQPYIEARDLILDQLQRAVIGADALTNEAAREFLGYAPVLETVAMLLAKEGNYHEFIESLKTMGKQTEQKPDRPMAILEHVVTRLLEREQTMKLQANIRPALEKVAGETGWSAWHELYSPDEQRARILGLILNRKIEACPNMPPSVRAMYEEQLKVWVPEHPFLRDGSSPANMVFESYLYANAMREYLTPLSRSVEERVKSSDYKPSRLLADFYIMLGEQRGENVVVEHQIGILYDSLLAGESDSLRVRMSIEAGDPDEHDTNGMEAEGEFELVYASPEPPDQERVEIRSFSIVNSKGTITFKRQLKDASITTCGGVTIGGDSDDFEIGPSVQIRCKHLRIHSSGLVVRGARGKTTGSEAVVLDAHECDSAVARKPLVRGSLTAFWPEAKAYPWSEYAVESLEDESENHKIIAVYHRLRRIVLSLRSHSKGSLARVKDKIDHQRVLKNEIGRALLERILDDGILVLKGKFYHWVPERGDLALGSSYFDFCQRRLTPEARSYLNEFIEQNENLF